MAKPKDIRVNFIEALRKIKAAGIQTAIPILPSDELDKLDSIDERINKIFRIYNKAEQNPTHMIYFVMYDIEDNKVRYQIAKYLLKKGCIRIQKSIFLAETNRALYNEIHSTLLEVQQLYDNEDSILMVPLSTDEIKAMKMIGQQKNIDFITKNPTTLFF